MKLPADASGRSLVVIPARYGSTRFPGKALADLGGRPLIVRVVENAVRIPEADEVVVATDDERIFAAVAAAGHRAVMTGRHATGTERVAEVARTSEAGIVVNLQGDEPLLDPAAAGGLIRRLREDPGLEVATCAHPFPDERLWHDPNAVKVLVDRAGVALYFSRAPIPGTFPGRDVPAHRSALRHVGIYAFRREALLRYPGLEPGALERQEGLEQLRIMEHGGRIGVVVIGGAPVGVDTPEDLEEVRRIWAGGAGRP